MMCRKLAVMSMSRINTRLNIEAPGVLKNDKDVDSEGLKAAVVKPPEHGTLTLNEKGGFSYLPADGYVGPDSFTYKASDGAREQ